MKVREACSENLHSIEPTDSIRHAARVMSEHDIGSLVIVSEGRLCGIVTDRDLVTRALATGASPYAPVRRVMTADVRSCSLDDEVDDAVDIMSSEQIRRLPVCTNGGEVVGIITIGDVVGIPSRAREATEALGEICRPSQVPCRVPMFA